MKFLCLTCNEQMKLADLEGPTNESISMTFSCPTCQHSIGMLTNPLETQMLKSMDVQVGGADLNQTSPSGGKCPIGGMLREKEAERIVSAMQNSIASGADSSGSSDPVWTDEAAERLQHIPSFVQPMAKSGIEEFARQRGHSRITAEVMDEARSQFGM